MSTRAFLMPSGPSADPAGSFLRSVPGPRSPLRFVLRRILRAWMRVRVEGHDHIPERGPVIVASTHLSHADSLALGTAILRPSYFLGDLHLTRWPIFGPMLPRFGMVPLRRGEADGHAMDVLAGLLRHGKCVTVYPEGSRSRDGRVHRLRSGAARLAADQQVKVVPACVIGIERVWPIGGRPRVLGGKVTVRFGSPLDPPEANPRSRRVFNERLQRAMADLAGAEMANDYLPAHGGEAL